MSYCIDSFDFWFVSCCLSSLEDETAASYKNRADSDV